MKVLIDTNIAIDVLLKRKGFVRESAKIIELSEKSIINGYITTNSIIDAHYIISKNKIDETLIRKLLIGLLHTVAVIDVLHQDIAEAFDSKMHDYEDAVVAACAQRAKVSYIITRNQKDFINSPIPAISPKQFLKLHCK